MDVQVKECCICGITFQGYGNNPDGAAWVDEDGEVVFGQFNAEERCCDACNNLYVRAGRIYSAYKAELSKGE